LLLISNIKSWIARGQTGKGANRTLFGSAFMACVAGVQTGCGCLFRTPFLRFVLLEEQKNRDKAELGEAKELKKKSPYMFIALHLLLSGALSL